jgi:iron complex transport system substrate-binding protein
VSRTVALITIIVAVFALSYGGKRVLSTTEVPSSPSARATADASAHRIVSLAPSITETLFALGMGDRVVAVTRYCDYPPEARNKMRVGGFYDANYEAILGLAPELAILLPEQEKIRQFLTSAGIATLIVNNKTIPDILAALREIGKRCGAKSRSERLVADLGARMDRFRKQSTGVNPPRVLVSIGGSMRSGSLETICVAGRKSLYGEMIELAGGTNVYHGSLPFPDVSREAIAELNPQVIIDIVVNPHYEPLDTKTREATMRQWREIASRTEAIRMNRVYIMEKDYNVIPGPRFIYALEDMAKAIFPEGTRSRNER